jgi:hypothetical protein
MTDKPDHLHPEYEAMLPKWQRCRDVLAGQDAVHKAGIQYLPALTDQEPNEYKAYKDRAGFYPATGRTWQGLLGLVFRQSPHEEAPEAAMPLLEDVTLAGTTAEAFAREIMGEIQAVGRYGVLVEYPRVAQQPGSLAEAGAQNLRPYATGYTAESIINWRVERVGNVMRPTLVVLAETHKTAGMFETAEEAQLRVLMLLQGQYVQQIWRKPEKSNDWALIEQIVPLRSGAPLSVIPFYPFGSEENSLRCQEPPLLDLVNVNLSHYRTTADLEHGAHYTGLPTPFIAGVTLGENEKIRIGSSSAIVSPDPQATASFLEFTGQGLGALEKLLDRKEAQMAAIGARMLMPEKAAVEAAETVAMRHNGENSVLAGQANLISSGVQAVLNFMREWAGIPGEISFRLSTDFLPGRMGPQELDALVKSWQAGAISKRTLFANLQMGEIVEPGKTFEDEEAEAAEDAPQLGTVTVNDGAE